jgi:cap1 methyltransferase
MRYYQSAGVGGIEGNGDVYQPDNLVAFKKFVFENTDNKGVHFVMADGVSIFVIF